MKRMLILPLMLLLGGCPGFYGDFVYGVHRSANLEMMPSVDCVRSAMTATSGISTVEFRQSTGSRPLTWSGVQAPDDVYDFSFAGSPGSHIGGTLQITKNYKAEIRFDESALSMGGPPPREQLDATHPVMVGIESALAARCGLSSLPTEIKESCIGMDCKPNEKSS